MAHIVAALGVKEKRELFKWMRTGKEVDEHTFFPRYGLTAGEFAIFHILTDTGRNSSGAANRARAGCGHGDGDGGCPAPLRNRTVGRIDATESGLM